MFDQYQLSECIDYLGAKGQRIACVDVEGDWAEYNIQEDIAQFILGTKAETLGRLKNLLQKAEILDQVSFTLDYWKQNSEKILDEVASKFPNDNLVVRSSALSEDAFTHSNAGCYESVLDVSHGKELRNAINLVINSYTNPEDADQVLVQPMLSGVSISGVIFTRTLEYGAPWYVVNYETSGSTDAITSGISNNYKTTYVRRDTEIVKNKIGDNRLLNLIYTVKEIEGLLEYDDLDIEFAIDQNQNVYILQVRPIAVSRQQKEFNDKSYYELVDLSKDRWISHKVASPHFPQGAQPLFGIMPDWNPAEIIGTVPTALSSSLYQYLIMDEIWATQRAEYGYNDVRPAKLLEDFCGHSFVDVRASFASFIPRSLGADISSKLLKFYTERLVSNPSSHDKVEFDIVATCLAPSFDVWRHRFLSSGLFSDKEVKKIENALRNISIQAFSRTSSDLKTNEELSSRYRKIIAQPEINPINRAWLLLEDCKRFGTLPFAHLARSGFVAITLLREAVEIGVLSPEARDSFMSSIKTVSHDLTEDGQKVKEGILSWNKFVDSYGHLRPGTYDITSPRYDSDTDKYLKPLTLNSPNISTSDNEIINPWENEKKEFCKLLSRIGLPSEQEVVETFLRDAIEGREDSKFIFTRNLSAALESINDAGEELGLSREQLSHISIHDIFGLRNTIKSKNDLKNQMSLIASQNERLHNLSKGIPLPFLITALDEFDCFTSGSERANFVGSKTVIANIYDLSVNAAEDLSSLKGMIIMIPQADPGYDWLFGHEIAGLITMFGGANSHMAIRAAEFGLPAAIGIGERKYVELSKSKLVQLSPGTEVLRAL